MLKYKPKNKIISIEDIISAIEPNNFDKAIVREFATSLTKELERLFSASTTAFPDKNTVNDLNSDLRQLNQIARKLKKSTKKSPHVEALLKVCAKNIREKKYNPIDLQDIIALTKITLKSSQHIRFNNKGNGPDRRLAKEVALLIARHYKKLFRKLPGLTTPGTTVNGKVKATPFGRICNVVARTKGIRIGSNTQKDALELLKSGKPAAFDFFKVDVSSLEEKTLD